MKKIGFIGFGSMGSMLVRQLVGSGKVLPNNLIIATRTLERLATLRSEFPDIQIAPSNVEAARVADVLFLCVKPMDIGLVLTEISPALAKSTHVVSIASAISIAAIEGRSGWKVSKVIPAVTSEVCAGVSLVCHGQTVTPEDAGYLENLLSGIGSVELIAERDFALATEITSCGPGFFASILQELIRAAGKQGSGLAELQIQRLATRTFYGTGKLLVEQGTSCEAVIQRVATKGGITEEGVRVFRNRLPLVYAEVFERTSEKRRFIETRARGQRNQP